MTSMADAYWDTIMLTHLTVLRNLSLQDEYVHTIICIGTLGIKVFHTSLKMLSN